MKLEEESRTGRRVASSDGQYRGTVLYDGEVNGTNGGRWLGVDWDEPGRGKHDGSHKGVSYFKASGPTSGSFVRPEKLQLGRTCSEALLEQYEPAFEAQLTTFRTDGAGSGKTAEFVGFEKHLDKISRTESLREAVLAGLGVSHGAPDLTSLCPNLVELDVGRNLISSVEQLATILDNLPTLRTVVISQNRIGTWDTAGHVFHHIQHLVAAEMRLQTLDNISVLFPNLVTLKAPRNEISNFTENLQFSQLEELDLDSNSISSWAQVLRLSSMPTLHTLHLNSNNIECVQMSSEDTLPSLRNLFLSGNVISDWASVSALAHLPQLEELSFKDNPVLKKESPETNRQIIICRLDRLRSLDKIQVTKAEKRGAAFDYLKKYGHEYLQSKSDPERLAVFLKLHPCYKRLVAEHGEPEASEVLRDTGHGRLKNSLVSVLIECPKLHEILEKKVPRTMKVQRLRGMMPKLLPAAPSCLKLRYVSSQKPDVSFDFDNDLRDLAYYSIQDRDTILVDW